MVPSVHLPVDPAAAALLPLIPVGTVDVPGASSYIANVTLPTSWREELVRVDHNINDHNRATFRYIHDSWNTIEPGPIWDCGIVPDGADRFRWTRRQHGGTTDEQYLSDPAE